MAQVLLLNSTYEPLTVVEWTRAITLLFSGKVEVIEEYDKEIRSSRMTIKVPAVVRLLNHARVRHRAAAKFTRQNLFARDSYTCHYCYEKFDGSELTFDHVVPIAQGGRKTWDNIVTACIECNSKKEGRTPEQAGMHLMKRPKQPTWSHVINIMIGVKNTPELWKNYLYHGDHNGVMV